MAVKLKWLGHSCFRVECGNFSIVLDPFAPGSVPGCADIRETADLVLCSHEHGDHNYRGGVTIREGGNNPFRVTEIASYHDDQNGALRGKNIITVLEAEGVKLAHMGDIGCMPGPAALEKLQGADAILLPVGGHYTVGPVEAKAIVDAVHPKTVIPMHYRSESFGFDVIGTVEDFLALCSSVTRLDSDALEIGPNTPEGVVVLTYKRGAQA